MAEELTGFITLTITDAIVPTVAEVGALIRARTRDDDSGDELGTFTTTTHPTATEVQSFIEGAVDTLRLGLPDVLPAKFTRMVRRLAARGAAMDVEISLDQERAESNDNAYARLKERYDTDYALLMAAGEDQGVTATPRSGSAKLRSSIVDMFGCASSSYLVDPVTGDPV